jgi:capsular polysaccharide export protein
MEEGIMEYKFNPNSHVINNYTNELIKGCNFVITLNSTVGFEALQHHKKVIVLGEAIYKISGIVISSNKQTFFKDLYETCKNNNKINKILIDNFIKYLKYYYQINGNLFNYDNRTLNDIKEKLDNKNI